MGVGQQVSTAEGFGDCHERDNDRPFGANYSFVTKGRLAGLELRCFLDSHCKVFVRMMQGDAKQIRYTYKLVARIVS